MKHLPYGVERGGEIIARFADRDHAETFKERTAAAGVVRRICACGNLIQDAAAVRQGDDVWCSFQCPLAPSRTVERWWPSVQPLPYCPPPFWPPTRPYWGIGTTTTTAGSLQLGQSSDIARKQFATAILDELHDNYTAQKGDE